MATNDTSRLITVAIHTYKHAARLRSMLEGEGIEVEFTNVNIANPTVSSGIRVRIHENDLPLALRIIENPEVFSSTAHRTMPNGHAGEGASTHPILVPVDFSEHSLDATKVACVLAAAHNVDIILLNSFIDPYVAGNMQLTDSLTYEIADSNTRAVMENSAVTQMKHFTDRLRKMMKSGEIPVVKFSTKVVEGVPEDSIIEYARNNPPYMVVMGTRGTDKKEKDMVGSVTAEVLDACRFSVLAIPEDTLSPDRRFKLDNVLFLCNLEQEDILAMDTFYRLFMRQSPNVTIVHIPGKKRGLVKEPKDSLESLLKYCRNNFQAFTFDSAQLSLSTLLEDFRNLESGRKIDLIVVPNKKKKNVFSRLFNPGLAHKILFATDIPMLVIPV